VVGCSRNMFLQPMRRVVVGMNFPLAQELWLE
jgi:hypothetical protein